MNNSPLGKLPPELRNVIYELALRHETPMAIKMEWNNSLECIAPVRSDCYSNHINTSLMRVCKAIHQETGEASEMFFAVNTFVFDFSAAKPYRETIWTFPDFARYIGKRQARSLRAVVFQQHSAQINDLAQKITDIRDVVSSYPRCNVELKVPMHLNNSENSWFRGCPGLSNVTCDVKNLAESFDRVNEMDLVSVGGRFRYRENLEAARKLLIDDAVVAAASTGVEKKGMAADQFKALDKASLVAKILDLQQQLDDALA